MDCVTFVQDKSNKKAVLHDDVHTKILKFVLYCSKNKRLYVIMCIYKCVYTRKEKTMIIPNDISKLSKLNDKKLTSAFENEIIFSRKRDKLIHVRLTKEEKKTVEMMAEYHNLPVSAYIRALVKQDMRRSRQVTKIKEAGGSVD